MCECGCSGLVEWSVMPGPKRQFYLIGVYPSCSDCDTPTGIDIRRMGARQVEDETGRKPRELPWIEFYDGEATIPVLHPNILARRFKEFATGIPVGEPEVKMDDIDAEILFEDFLREHFVDAVNESMRVAL